MKSQFSSREHHNRFFEQSLCQSSLSMLLSIGLATGGAFAAEFTWDGLGTNSSWNQAANWNPDGTPSFGNQADLIFTGTKTNTQLYGNRTARSLTFAAAAADGFEVKLRTSSAQATAGGANLTLVADSGNATITVEAGAGSAKIYSGPLSGAGDGGNVILNSNLVVNHGGSNLLTIGDVSSYLTGAGAVTKTGSGTLVLAGANDYAGDTEISGGTLSLLGNGAINGSANIIVGASTTFDVSGATSGFTLGASQTLSGTGTVVGAATIAGTLSPGNSPGSLATDNQTWTDGGHYNWQVLDANGSAGTGYDTIAVNGTLDLGSLTTAGFSINLWSLSSIAPDVSGDAANFDNSLDYSWTLLTTSGGITGFNAANFDILVGSNNGTDGFSNSLNSGSFSVSQSGNNLQLNFTAVPEPGAALLGGLGLLAILRRRRLA